LASFEDAFVFTDVMVPSIRVSQLPTCGSGKWILVMMVCGVMFCLVLL